MDAPSTVTSPAWMPVIVAFLSVVVGPAVLFLLMRGERQRNQAHRESVDHAQIQVDLLGNYQRQLETLTARSDRIDQETAEWQARYWQAVNEKSSDKERFLKKLEEALHARATVEGEHLRLRNQIARLQHALTRLDTVIERRVKPLTDEERQILGEARTLEREAAVSVLEQATA